MADLYEYYDDEPDIYTIQFFADYWKAQTFVVGSVGADEEFKIEYVQFYGKRTGSAGTITCDLHEVDGSREPILPAVSSGSILGSAIGTSNEWFQIDMSAFNCQPSTEYALVVKCSGADSSNKIDIYRESFGGGYTDGATWWTDTGWANWAVIASYTLYFKVYGGTPVTTSPVMQPNKFWGPV